MPFTVLVAPSGFKESLDVQVVTEAIVAGVRRAAPQVRILAVPMFDGGDGFTQSLLRITGGTRHSVWVTGPLGDPVEAEFGMLKESPLRTAVVELASAAGLRLIPPHLRYPERSTSRGVGELISAALDAGAQRILVGCGDSGVHDGGAGMLRALGFRLLDWRGDDLRAGGAALADLTTIDASGRDPRLNAAIFEACVNGQNMLLGPHGVSRIFGPQKGANAEQVHQLDRALTNYAARIEEATGCDVANVAGSGASGGVGAALHAFLGATLTPRYDFVSQFVSVDDLLDQADLVITAEGCIDQQTCRGKIPGEIARRAKVRGCPVIVLAGSIGEGANEAYACGVDAFVSILDQPVQFEEAAEQARRLLEQCTENVVRILCAGHMIGAAAQHKQNGRSEERPLKSAARTRRLGDTQTVGN